VPTVMPTDFRMIADVLEQMQLRVGALLRSLDAQHRKALRQRRQLRSYFDAMDIHHGLSIGAIRPTRQVAWGRFGSTPEQLVSWAGEMCGERRLCSGCLAALARGDVPPALQPVEDPLR